MTTVLLRPKGEEGVPSLYRLCLPVPLISLFVSAHFYTQPARSSLTTHMLEQQLLQRVIESLAVLRSAIGTAP